MFFLFLWCLLIIKIICYCYLTFAPKIKQYILKSIIVQFQTVCFCWLYLNVDALFLLIYYTFIVLNLYYVKPDLNFISVPKLWKFFILKLKIWSELQNNSPKFFNNKIFVFIYVNNSKHVTEENNRDRRCFCELFPDLSNLMPPI